MSTEPGIRLGWIGVGRMGQVLAARLLEAGQALAVYNRTREKCAPLEKLGATVVERPADLADCDVVFTMVAGSADVQEVVDGLLSRADRAPRVIVDSTTISPASGSHDKSVRIRSCSPVRTATKKSWSEYASASAGSPDIDPIATRPSTPPSASSDARSRRLPPAAGSRSSPPVHARRGFRRVPISSSWVGQ